LNVFQAISDKEKVTITVGAPIKSDAGIFIGMIIFQPNMPRQLYCKQHLHADEIPYFIPGEKQVYLERGKTKLAFSICYELSVPGHAANVYKNGANFYLSSVAKTAEGVANAVNTLSATAKQYSMMVMMSNCVGHCDNFDCGGKSSAWNNKGELIGQLDDSTEGILIVDTVTAHVVKKNLSIRQQGV
jgi:predicted amidohydrolase